MATSDESSFMRPGTTRIDETMLSDAQRSSLDKCRERNRVHARRSRQRKKAAQSGMVVTLERRCADLSRYDRLLESHSGATYAEHLSRKGAEPQLASVRRRLDAASDELPEPTAGDDSPFPLPTDASADDRVARSRERNRLHARRSRQRKKLLMESLKEQCDACSADVASARGMLVSIVGGDHPDLAQADEAAAASAAETMEAEAEPQADWSPPSRHAQRRTAASKRSRDESTGDDDDADGSVRSTRPRRAAAQRAVASMGAGADTPDSDSTGQTERVPASVHAFAPARPIQESHGRAPRAEAKPTDVAVGSRVQIPSLMMMQGGPPLGHAFASRGDPRTPAQPLRAGASFAYLPSGASPHPYADALRLGGWDPSTLAAHRVGMGYSSYPSAASGGYPSSTSGAYPPPQHFFPPHAQSVAASKPAVSDSEAALCLMSLCTGRRDPAPRADPVVRSVDVAMARTGHMLEWRQ